MNLLQQKLFQMLIWFHSFCQEHSLRYYIVGGTFLGAVRHQGFIPWDDDVDIGMPAGDYLKFITLTKDLSKKYRVESPINANVDFLYSFAKLYDTQTTAVENQRPPIKRGIYLDIFPLCGFGNTFQETQRFFKKINFLQNLRNIRTMASRKGRKWYKNWLVRTARMIPLCLITKYVLPTLQSYLTKKDFDSCIFVGNPVCTWGNKEIMRRDFFGKPTLYSFEKITVYGPEKADEYLTALYGNWRELPPIEKQKSHHNFLYLNLEKSYLDQAK